MHRRNKIIAALFVTLGLGAGAAAAHGGFGKHRDPAEMQQRMDKKLDRALGWLDATDAQKDAIKQIKNRLAPQFQALGSQRAELRAFALEQLKADKPDAKAIHAEIDARIDALRALAHETADGLIEVHGVLTPEQRGEIVEKVGKWHGRK